MYGNPRYPHVFTPPFPTRVSSDLVETTDEIGRKRLHALVAQHVEHGLHHNLDRGPRRLRIGHVERFRRIDDAELRHLAMLDECALVGFGQILVHARCRDVAGKIGDVVERRHYSLRTSRSLIRDWMKAEISSDEPAGFSHGQFGRADVFTPVTYALLV